MDLYGYPNYEYNQNNELAQQMYAQQALASPVQYRVNAEPHMMPAPSGAPWNSQGLPWGMQSPPQLVQFTATFPNNTSPSPQLHCKRKNPEVDIDIPAKQFISEDKMVAHLNSLHLSNTYTSHSLSCGEVEMALDSSSLEKQKPREMKIVLSDEIKNLKHEPLIPETLLQRLEKPCMSLVVWEPKSNIVEKVKEATKMTDDEEQTERSAEPQKRNGVLVTEYTGMDVETL